MNDLSRIVDEMCAWFDGPDPASVPAVPTSAEHRGNEQGSVIIGVSHTSRISHTENDASQKAEQPASENAEASARESRVASSCVGDVGSVGNVESEAETPAETTSLPFPQDFKKVGSVGTEDASRGRPFLDLNRAAPQRSDWWTGPAMAEADRLAQPAEPLPISPTDVWAGVDRERAALADLGLSDVEVWRRAIEITIAKIRNSEALAERQAHVGRCHVCDAPLDDAAPVVAVLSWSRGGALHMHAGCHDAYRARRTELVDRIMASAGLQREAAGR